MVRRKSGLYKRKKGARSRGKWDVAQAKKRATRKQKMAEEMAAAALVYLGGVSSDAESDSDHMDPEDEESEGETRAARAALLPLCRCSSAHPPFPARPTRP